MQIMKCQDFAPTFLYLSNLLIPGHITYVLLVIAACIEGRCAYLIEISFVQFLMMYLALSRHLMVTFINKNSIHAKQFAICLRFENSQKNLEIFEDLKGYL